MLPDRRIETLISQARQHQRNQCIYHTSDTHTSLFSDHFCDRSLFPNVTTHILANHKDEVWCLAFSPSGRYLATGSKDKQVIIWRVASNDVHRVLAEHVDGVGVLAWSPNENFLLTAAESTIKIWDVEVCAFIQPPFFRLHYLLIAMMCTRRARASTR
jgi:WD40 repeat protein